MFPDSDHLPSLGFQAPVDFFIPLHVLLQLFLPKIPVVLRHCKMLRAFVPEAAVNKNHRLLADEHHVRLPDQSIFKSISITKSPQRMS